MTEDKELLEVLQEFNVYLAENQEPLEDEFVKVLHDKLWSLYGT